MEAPLQICCWLTRPLPVAIPLRTTSAQRTGVVLGGWRAMEKVTVSKMQAVELAKDIVEARDAKLAFLLQVQEIVKSTTALPDHASASCENVEGPSQPFLVGIDLKDSQIAGDQDKDVALDLAVDELGVLVEETEETQLSLIEANRLAHLDAIQEHDAQFARSIANMPHEDWEETGDEMEEPFEAPNGPGELFAYNEVDDQFESVLSQLGDASTFPRKGSPGGGVGMEKNLLVIRRAKVPTSVNLHEIPKRDIVNLDQQDKGKSKIVLEDDDDSPPASPLSVGGPSKRARSLPLCRESLEPEDGDAGDHIGDGKSGQRVCQICFEASLDTSPFVSLEGCGHEFCETCVTRHAEAKILDGGQMHIPCPHVGCDTIMSFTQLTFFLNSKMLEILSRRQIEAAIPDSERTYCPFRDCSALLFKPSIHAIQQLSSSAHPHPTAFGCVECEACHRAFCLECEVAWHADMSCAEYKATLKNRRLLGDEKLLQLAGKQKWQRCKKCGRVVELTRGCYHISCLCGHGFCYLCGAPWISKDKKTCSCPTWSESKL